MMCCLNTMADPCGLHEKTTEHPNALAIFIPYSS
jgi:hypothetical protein